MSLLSLCLNAVIEGDVFVSSGNLAKQQIPNKTIKMRQSDPPWLTCEIKIIIRKRKRLYNKYKKTKRPTDFEKYKHTRTLPQLKSVK